MHMMELPEIQSCVRDLDLTLQPWIAPRYKVWLPLATQQLRLRSLIQVIGHKLQIDEKCETCVFYYTLHRTCMSSPLYTSEPIDNVSPRWGSLEVPTLHATGHSTANEVILRVWKRITVGDATMDITVFTWGISFTGLAYIGPKLPNNLETILFDNSVIFQLHGGFFAPPFCLIKPPEAKRYLTMSVCSSPIEIRNSYTVSKLCCLRSKMQALKQQTDSVQNLRERIASGENLSVPKYPQSSLNRLLQPRRVNKEKKLEILKIKKELEVAKFRTKLLEQERVRKMVEVRILNQHHSDLMEENQDHGSLLMDQYRELSKDIERLHEWRQSHMDTRDTYIQTTVQLAHRRKQLISQLSFIYPIVEMEEEGKFTISDVYLPDSEKLDNANDTQVAVALGFVAHTTQMIANFLNIPTRYPILHCGSRSKIIDHINENLLDCDRQFPLFARSKDKLQFHYAVYSLNKNIAQLRWYCGLPTMDLRATLQNLASLINIKPNQFLDSSKRTFSGSSLDVDMGSNKGNPPLTPPIGKSLFEKFHRPLRPTSHLKTAKSLLGASLDQGLNKPTMQSRVLNRQSKRICKSEDSAIDNAIPRDESSISSNETLNETIFDKKNVPINGVKANREIESNDIAFIENSIEIMIPMSVSKGVLGILEGSTSATRQRSSNSISSCEMALSSTVDEDSSNGNSMRNKGVFTSVENVKRNSISNEDIPKCTDQNNCRYSSNQKQYVDKICDHEAEETKSSEKADSDSKENPSASECPRNSDKDSRPGQSQTHALAERLPKTWLDITAKERECDSEVDFALNAESPEFSLSRSYTCDSQRKREPSNIAESIEYMASIRRSSEDVFARTEALANKTTSFKVMRPRL